MIRLNSFLFACGFVFLSCATPREKSSSVSSRFGVLVSDDAVVLHSGANGNGTGVRVGDHTILSVDHVISSPNPKFLVSFFNFGTPTQSSIN
jgi:hypothetical protein